MSSTPKVVTLSTKQLNKTLSAKKKPLKTVKTILSSKDLDWPALENSKELFDEMFHIGLHELKSDSGKQTQNSNDLRKSILFGVNQINRCLKKDECALILFDANTPPLLFSHSINLAKSKNIPSFLVPELRKFLFTNLTFKSSSMCFKSDVQFAKLMQIISNGNTKGISGGNETEKMEVCPIAGVKELVRENPVEYLKRPDNGERAFNPPLSKQCNKKVAPKSMDYIKLPESKRLSQNRKEFKPLYIKRIQSNGNRKHKKNKNNS